MSYYITCNWCDIILNGRCDYVLENGLPLSCCKNCLDKFKNNNQWGFYDEYFVMGDNVEQYIVSQENEAQKPLEIQWNNSSFTF
jgi:hypothetical protein